MCIAATAWPHDAWGYPIHSFEASPCLMASEDHGLAQAQLPAPSFPAFWKGICVAFVIICFCDYPVAIAGYWAYGNKAQDNVYSNISGPPWMKAVGYMLIVIHMVGANQVSSNADHVYVEDISRRGWT